MNIKQTLMIAGVSAVLLGGVGVASVSAQATTDKTSFVAELAQKLGIDQSKVQTAVEQIRDEHKGKMEQKFTAMLDQAVKDGKITEAQKQLILNKRKELESQRQTNRDSMKNLTPEQRKAAMDKERTDLETWAKQNNIDIKYLFGGGGRHGGMMKGGMHNFNK